MQKAKCRGFYKLVYYMPAKKTPVQNRLIYTVKQTRDRRTVDFLAKELWCSMKELLKEESIEQEQVILTYIPRSAMAKLQYGTDQAKELARAISRLSGIPMESLIRRKGGRANSQKKLDPIARYKNAKNSFDAALGCDVDLKGKTVLLIDDIVTTGASMAVGTRLLRKMGAAEVYAFAIASDIYNRDRSVY
jgi:ComF family protein